MSDAPVMQFNAKKFSEDVRKKRGIAGVREMAKVVGISPATLSRIERGGEPDVNTFLKIIAWLQLSPNATPVVGPPPNIAQSSLRDWFAGQALVGVMAKAPDTTLKAAFRTAQSDAREAYQIADAMMAAREGE